MRLARKSRPFPDVDVTSFGDLAFLLIIFFILTTTFVKPMGSRLTIPSGTSDPNRKSDKDFPTINISADRILFNKDEVSFDELRRKLAGMKLPERREEERIIIVEAAPDVPFDRYFKVVTAVSRSGGILAIVEYEESRKDGKAGGQEASE